MFVLECFLVVTSTHLSATLQRINQICEAEPRRKVNSYFFPYFTDLFMQPVSKRNRRTYIIRPLM